MSTWARDEDRLLLLELVAQGIATARRSQDGALRHLADLGWILRTRRSSEWALAPEARARIEILLDREWPPWREVLSRLLAEQLPATPDGWSTLRDRERIGRLGALPPVLHEKTWAALTSTHSKVGHKHAPDATTRLTSDQVIRLRPSPGVLLVDARGELDASALAERNGGEVVLTQRALLGGTRLGGRPPRGLLLVENLGAYLDVALPNDVMAIHVPGWDSALVRLLVDSATQVPLLHFGDLDPAGVRMAEHLRSVFPSLRWWVPSFAPEYFEAHAQRCDGWQETDWTDLPESIRLLVERGQWLEQECLVLDARCASELEALLAS